MMPIKLGAALTAFAALVMVNTPAAAQSLGYADPNSSFWSSDRAFPQPRVDEDSALPDRLKRTIVNYPSRELPGTIIVDTRNTQLYLTLGDNRAIRYGVGVGREGFTWSGVQSIARKAEWPDWHPPAQMIARQPYLPRFVAGGPGNPLGARAMYLGNSDFRIHGTNDPSTIGKFVSSGCIRLTNEDVTDLFNRVKVGAKVIVLPKSGSPQFEAKQAPASYRPVTSRTQTGGQPIKLSSIN
ncbi:MAG: L,D-transpeptidase [Xanthobacteraceae bacterium]|nr:L,D-transpeptidase [Xanthobacteraceae bacterium]